jgi:hypothetical protein
VPIEKIIIRMLIAIAVVAIIIVLTFYPPSYALPPVVFLIMCFAAEFALPNDSKKEAKGLSKTASNVLIWLLGISALAATVIVGLLWKTGAFWRLK